MRILLRIVLGLIALVALLFGVGLLLPRDHVATSEIVLAQPPDSVWPVVRDLGALQGTWADLESATRLPDRDGREVWEQRVSGFPMRLVVEEERPPSRLVTRVDTDAAAAFGGTWTYVVEPAARGTRVRVTEAGWVRNPLFRVMMAVGGVHTTLDGYLRALGARFGESVAPRHVD